MIKTVFDEKVDEGIAIGEVKASRNLVLTVLRSKFGKVPKRIENAVCQKNDPIVLESLAAQIVHCSTLDEFAEGL